MNAETENLHLKELLKRIQDENVSLRNTSFTFSVPRNGELSDTPFSGALSSFDSPPASFLASTSHLPSPSSSAPKAATPQPSSLDIPSAFPADIDFGTLTSIDSESLSLLDDSDAIMSYDFGYGQFVPSKTPYKTIASNPMFMSFADPTADTLTFGQWTGQTSSQEGNVHASSIDELFGGHIFGSQSPLNFNVLMKSPATSPIASTAPASSPVIHQSMHTLSSGASPIVSTVFESSEESSPAASSSSKNMCPKTRAQLEQKIQAEGSSMFAPPPPQEEEPQNKVFTLPAGADGPMVMCKDGVTFPRTEKSDKNIEVLTAWRSITSHPQFKASVSGSPFLTWTNHSVL